MLAPSLARLRTLFGSVVVSVLLAVIAAVPSSASPGYELDPVAPSISLSAELPHGIAVDQVSQTIYVTELTTDFFNVGHGQIEQFDSSGVATANSPFITGGGDYFTGVAVNPVTQGIYAYQTQLSTPLGVKGVSQMNTFTSSGVVGTSFNPTKSTAPQLAADSAGRVYFPNDSSNAIQVFSPSGALEETISCAGCAGGAFNKPLGAALDAAGNLDIVDIGNEGRVIKFKPSGGSYVYDSVLQSGEGAVAVGVDPSSGDVFVGDFAEGTYHVVAYDSSGTQFDDFGGGIVSSPPFGIESSGQIAANATTHEVYVSGPSNNELWVFDRIASIPAPTAADLPASSLGQVNATLNASVNPKSHGLLDCHFEYTDGADFQAHGFSNAITVPCPFKPVGPSAVMVSRRLSGLAPSTSYDYRIVVATNGGSASGTAQEFETLPPLAPSVVTGSASSISQTTAKLAGSVNPHGGPISDCYFEYVDKADFDENGFAGAATVECDFFPEGTDDEPVSAKIKGLIPDTGYHFRLVATNNSGTSKATDQAFATLADTCATNPALCPPPEGEESKKDPQPPPAPVQPAAPAPPTAKPLKCRRGFKKKTVRGKPKCVKIKKHKRRHR